MKIGDLFRDREKAMYPSQDDILSSEKTSAMLSYPLAKSEYHALAMKCRTLGKNIQERTEERDKWRARAFELAEKLATLEARQPIR